jgi:hypothetical protein
MRPSTLFIMPFAAASVCAAICTLGIVPAQAQQAPPPPPAPIRTYLALTGSDSNPCTFALPCKSVQHAHDVVAASGEIRMLDPGSYGLVTITKSVSILGDGHGGVAASNFADAITINAGVNDRVNLRGLVIEGFNSGGVGIRFNTGANLNIQDSIIRNFITGGINFATVSKSDLNVKNTLISGFSNTGIAIRVEGTGAGAVTATISHATLDHGGSGMGIGTGQSSAVRVTVADSTISNFVQFGILAEATSGTGIDLMVRNTTASNNVNGIEASGPLATIWVTKSTVSGNTTGLVVGNSANLISFGDNDVSGNTTDGAPSSTTTHH